MTKSAYATIENLSTRQALSIQAGAPSLMTASWKKECQRDYQSTRARRFNFRSRYFTDWGIIGGKRFVISTYQLIKENFRSKKDKIPKPVKGLEVFTHSNDWPNEGIFLKPILSFPQAQIAAL